MDPEVRELATAAVTALQTMAANSSPHWTDVAGVFVALGVGVAQCGLIAWGIRVMRDSNLTRESRHEEVMTAFARRDKEEQERHEEVMASLTRRGKEDQQRHEAVMASLTRQGEETERRRAESQQRHEEAMATFARQREDAERQREDAERQREDAERESQQRHEEAMAALTALIERTAPQGNV